MQRNDQDVQRVTTQCKAQVAAHNSFSIGVQDNGVDSDPLSFLGTYVSYSTKTNASLYHHNWILDTGATDHLISNATFFTSKVKLLRSVIVSLLDRSIKVVDIAETVQLSNQLNLQNVLFMSGFRHNLLLVGKLLDDSTL